MKTFKQYITEAKNCPPGTKYCNKCGSCLEKTCEDKKMQEAVNPADAQKEQQLQRKQLMLNRQKLQLQMKAVQKKKPTDMSMMRAEGAAWTRKEGQSEKGGLNEKGRKSYERENPGSDLKAPQPKGGPRKRSFCARMSGMKKKLTSKKTANDPDSRINKSLRSWNC
ncbi:hypothetical protein SSZBM1_192 [Synechococcus phage S-SZBM1]|uniref:Uncharacterized protein n=1 Tax=Synechococcus phage S-SZBM1 TaxID=2926475 RepID=A0AC61TT81_9CAUD|nr:hypothetical protein PP650_gp084 [Synechococcus phage S-SZBM1]UNH61309.1 hypothetical protein SSZBM1_192 [Synechococcus phage S-SZBM1]